jgi:RNA polymerase sigma factor (TIGR02999 family)
MEDTQCSETTRLLRAWANGDRNALDQLTPRVYNELRRIAGNCMRNERPGRSIQTTALVHEAYLKLIDVTNVEWRHRAHFFAISAQIMRHILLDRARRRTTAKRGGATPRLNLDAVPDIRSGRARELIALDDALNALANIDPRKARVIELRFFGGLSVEETAEVLGLSRDRVLRDWKLARAWLLAELGSKR